MKEEVRIIDATPSKRLFLSIIADYDLYKSICELADNAIDLWKINQREKELEIQITVDVDQQRIMVIDNAGGISSEDLTFIVAPGQSMNDGSIDTIGIFGVGTKRAVVALSQDITIRTRQAGNTYQVEIDDDWINNDDDWRLPVYKVANIEESTTVIELVKLRQKINDISIKKLQYYLSTTYAIFLKDERLKILLNGTKVEPKTYEDWAYPPEYPPMFYSGQFRVGGDDAIDVVVLCGLTKQSNDASGEYGVYLYCNDRLIARDLKTMDVGYGAGKAGKPGEEISLARIIIQLNGKPKYMPWNSSKSDINANNEIFLAIQDWLFKIVKHITQLSRRMRSLDGGWSENVFKYTEGEYEEYSIEDFSNVKTDYFAPLPKSTPRYADTVKKENKKIADKKPWTTGLYESVIAVDWILKSRLEQRNRIALILLDSTLEIAFKEYLVNNTENSYSEKRLTDIFKDRQQVHKEIKNYILLTEEVWGKINHFYNMRCQLIHSKASVTISNEDIDKFRIVVEEVLLEMYELKFPEIDR